MKTDKNTTVAEIKVFTKVPGKKRVIHGKFERRIEDILKNVYLESMKLLVSRIPESNKYEWKKVNNNTYELMLPKRRRDMDEDTSLEYQTKLLKRIAALEKIAKNTEPENLEERDYKVTGFRAEGKK